MPYLKEAVNSILNQTYNNFEFVIVDDASTDGTWKYLKALKDERLKLLKNSENLGLALSLNVALKVATGEYIARMDADDISLPNRFELQLNFLLKNPSVDICGTWVKLINSDGKIIKVIHKPTSDKEIKQATLLSPGLIHPTWFAKSKMFEKLGGYNPDFDMAEDYEFLLRGKEFKMANLDKELLLWRNAGNRRSKKSIDNMYRKSLKVRWKYFQQENYNLSFLPILLRGLISTNLFPTKLKILLNKKTG